MQRILKIKPFQETLNAGMCGPASLKIVLNYYGVDKTETELAKLTENQSDLGTTAEKIKIAAEGMGFNVVIKNECDFSDIESWLDKEVPIIVDWFTTGRSDYPEDIISADGHYSV
ncbi:MAG: C39 family peptidase, partial [Patescibacteria group bacterium]|nr:C39 family peptidase [Patescibacteria group bacterium]